MKLEETNSNSAVETQGMRPKLRTTIYVDPNLWREFKRICLREEDSMSRKLERFIARYVAVHSPGNPQLPLTRFVGEVPQKECFWCHGHFKVLYKVRYISGLVAPTCKQCLEANKAKGSFSTVKKVLGVIKQ